MPTVPLSYFQLRIAPFMPVGATYPNMDDTVYTNYWQSTLNDLIAASVNGEITHVQLRLYWTLDRTSNATMSNPYLGSTDPSQQDVMNNWRSWYFGNPVPATGRSCLQRIRDAGFKVEVGLSASFIPGNGMNIPPPFARYARESTFSGFDGSAFVTNYFNNCVFPIAQEAAPHLQAGDGFFIGFENYYPECDHPRLHSAEYSANIAQLRAMLPAGVYISEHITGEYDDRGLGYPPTTEGFLNIPYLASLDLIEPSIWTPWLSTGDLPATREKIRVAHFMNMQFNQTGTDLGGGVPGRNFMYDCELIYQKWGVPLLWNSGWRNCYGVTTWSNPEQNCTPTAAGIAEQAEAWAGRLLALGQRNDNSIGLWCAGQDFERYCEPATSTQRTASWRGRTAQTEIINLIDAIIGTQPPTQGRLIVDSTPTSNKQVVVTKV